MTTRIAINGFGRIGRAMFRILGLEPNRPVEIAAINGTASTETAAHLVRRDTTHGRYPVDVRAADGALLVEGKSIPHMNVPNPSDYDWGKQGVDIVLECTGKYTSADKARIHLSAGAGKVIVSAPAAGADATVVAGVNEESLAQEHKVISIGSCTTNCLAPMAKVLHDSFGIDCGWMSTIHSFTNDQRILDGRHSDLRRGRAAHGSVIPTRTGAAKAIGLVIPELEGKLSGIALRVPTPNVSLVDLTVLLKGKADDKAVNQRFKEASDGAMSGVLAYNTEPLVSVDFNGNPASCVFDATQTKVADGKLAKVLGWYDNEWGFACRMLDIAALAGSMLK